MLALADLDVSIYPHSLLRFRLRYFGGCTMLAIFHLLTSWYSLVMKLICVFRENPSFKARRRKVQPLGYEESARRGVWRRLPAAQYHHRGLTRSTPDVNRGKSLPDFAEISSLVLGRTKADFCEYILLNSTKQHFSRPTRFAYYTRDAETVVL